MTSPFPGMDPYLEGYLWPDVHHSLASMIKELLVPQISPKYVARVEIYTIDDASPEEEIGIMYPDVEVFKRKVDKPIVGTDVSTLVSPVTVNIPVPNIKVRIPVIQIKNRGNNELITAIEILSPVNKRKPNLKDYRQKRKDLYKTGVHLLEIDLLRRGTRPFIHDQLPDAHYLVSLIRANAQQVSIWAFNIDNKIPSVPVPLKKPDADVVLDLGVAMQTIYQRSQYQLSIDYTTMPPPPVFTATELNWIKSRIF